MAVDIYTTYESKGNREDITDEISNIAPKDVIFMNSIGTGKAKAVKHDFQTDTLRAASLANAQLQKAVPSYRVITPTVKLTNDVQFLDDWYQIADAMDQIDKAGRKSEADYQAPLFAAGLAKDIELSLLEQVGPVSDTTDLAAKMRGAENWCVTNIDKGANDTINGTTGVVTIVDGARSITEAMIGDTCQNIYSQGGEVHTALCGSYQKRAVSEVLQGASQRRFMIEKSKVDASVDVYASDFGTISFKIHRGMATSVIFFYDPKLWKKCWLQTVKKEILSRAGTFTNYQLSCSLTLEAKNEKGNGRIVNLATS